MILMYHNVCEKVLSKITVSVQTFDKQMEYLQDYEVVYLDDYDPQNPRHIALTFDDGYSDVVEYALPILEKWNYPFEMFVVGNYIGKSNSYDRGREPEIQCACLHQLKKATSSLARLQWHSRSHPRLGTAPIDVVRNELHVPEDLSSLFPKTHFRWLAYPYGDHSDEVVNLARSRFIGAVSVYDGNDTDKYQLNRIEVTEESKFFLSSYEKDIAMAKMENEIRVKDMHLAFMKTVFDSRSWRYTAPLRKLSVIAGKIKRLITR